MSKAKVLPDEETLIKAAEAEVFDVKGQKVKFGSLYKDTKTIVVFIRHFFCSTCQGYISQLANVQKSALDAANTRIVVIGCGEWVAIEAYAALTGFTGLIYADPNRQLFKTFGLIENLAITPSGEAKRSYIDNSSILSKIFTGIMRGPVKYPRLIGKQGNISQLGGDFVFGPGNTCTFASRMQHTEDHVEIADLMTAAGVQIH